MSGQWQSYRHRLSTDYKMFLWIILFPFCFWFNSNWTLWSAFLRIKMNHELAAINGVWQHDNFY